MLEVVGLKVKDCGEGSSCGPPGRRPKRSLRAAASAPTSRGAAKDPDCPGGAGPGGGGVSSMTEQ